MTLPIERRNAVLHTEQFLLDLCTPSKTPRVPSEVRKRAFSLLRHYPNAYYMERAAIEAPKIFGEWNSGLENSEYV